MNCLRLDLMQVFRIVSLISDIGSKKYSTKTQYKSTRGHSLKIQMFSYCLNIWIFFFSQCLVNEWNNPPPSFNNQCQDFRYLQKGRLKYILIILVDNCTCVQCASPIFNILIVPVFCIFLACSLYYLLLSFCLPIWS